MKPFNLEAALAGEPVQLRNGCKGLVIADIDNCKIAPTQSWEKPLIVVTESLCGSFSRDYFKKDGGYYEKGESPFDIVGMWQEPRPTIRLPPLPAPLKMLKPNQKYYTIGQNSKQLTPVERSCNCLGENEIEVISLAFTTKEDAEAWAAALSEARR